MKNQRLTKFIAFTSAFVIAALAIIPAPQTVYAETTDWPTPPDIIAGSAILIDADTGAVLYDKNSHSKAYPASITKLMTGLLTIENCTMDEIVTFSATAAKSVKWDEANIATKIGEQYTVEQSLYALLLSSANEVAYGLAEHVGGTLASFVDMMNTRAKELGALNTHFNNASGLNDPNHYTTAYDMAMIGRACFTNPTFVSIDSFVGYYKLGPTNLTPEVRSLRSTNLMFKGQQYYYQYCKGGKTGFTDESGFTLISYAEKDGMRLICVTMKEPLADNRYTDTKALFEYGFNNFKKVSISDSDVNSLFNSSNYYNSAVYGNSTINFSMDASYVDIPNAAQMSDIGLVLDTNAADTPEDTAGYDYTAKLNFIYNGYTVGSANLLVNTQSTLVKSSNLPYLETDESATPGIKKCLVINVWHVAILAAILLVILKVVADTKRIKQKNRRKSYRNNKLHY